VGCSRMKEQRHARSGEGYGDARFAASLSQFGTPVALRHSGANILLVRDIERNHLDAVGPYPLLSCPRPQLLVEDLDQLRSLGAITFTAVLDPLQPAVLPDDRLAVLRPFKTHFLTVPSSPATRPSRHHQREIRSALRSVTVHVEAGVEADLEEWLRLWDHLVARHRLTGMRAGSRETFAAQFALSGAIVMWASCAGDRVAAQLVLVSDEVVYAHLAVASTIGRESRAMYALDATLVELFEGQGRTIHWGGGSGAVDVEDGLTAYKRGWANATRQAQLLGAILDSSEYARLGGQVVASPLDWFPAYSDADRSTVGTRSSSCGRD